MRYVPASSPELRREDILGRKTDRTTHCVSVSNLLRFDDMQDALEYTQELRRLAEEDEWLKDIIRV